MFQVLLFFHNFLQKLNKNKNKEFWVLLVQASNQLFYFQSIKIILGPSDAWLMRRLTQRIILMIVGFLVKSPV